MRREKVKKETRKPRTAADKGKRYRCCVCKKRAPQKTKTVPYYCELHRQSKESD